MPSQPRHHPSTTATVTIFNALCWPPTTLVLVGIKPNALLGSSFTLEVTSRVLQHALPTEYTYHIMISYMLFSNSILERSTRSKVYWCTSDLVRRVETDGGCTLIRITDRVIRIDIRC